MNDLLLNQKIHKHKIINCQNEFIKLKFKEKEEAKTKLAIKLMKGKLTKFIQIKNISFFYSIILATQVEFVWHVAIFLHNAQNSGMQRYVQSIIQDYRYSALDIYWHMTQKHYQLFDQQMFYLQSQRQIIYFYGHFFEVNEYSLPQGPEIYYCLPLFFFQKSSQSSLIKIVCRCIKNQIYLWIVYNMIVIKVYFSFLLNFYQYQLIKLFQTFNLYRRINIIIMSITVSNCAQICNAPHNTSPSKMLYSFPKAQRFNENKENLKAPYYNVSRDFLKRATSFGYGTKYDFTKDMPKTPPPTQYQVKSFLEQSKSQKKGFCFGGGRQNMIVTGPLAETINNKNPGPGSYEIPGTRSRTYYSLKGKRQDVQADKTPGPGSYQMNASLNKSGSNFYSKFKDHKALRFDNNTQRFRKTTNEFPGPGNYNTSTIQLSSKGRYILSNLQNSKTRSFGSSVRKSLNLSKQTPGPGNYQLPSEFGYYASKKQFTKQSILKKQRHQKENNQTETSKGVMSTIKQ